MKNLLFTVFGVLIFAVNGYAQDVYIQGNKFYQGNERWMAKGFNYRLSINQDESGKWFVAPHTSYCGKWDNKKGSHTCGDELECLRKLKEDFKFIADAGFNTVRVTGLALYKDEESDRLYNEEMGVVADSDLIIDMMAIIDEIAADNKLKVIMLMGRKNVDHPNIQTAYIDFLKKSSRKFKDSKGIWAFDLYNEPRWESQDLKFSLDEIASMEYVWYRAIRNNSDIYVTIGIHGTLDVSEWDPGVLTVDFFSLHFYPEFSDYDNHNNQAAADRGMRNLYWYKQAISAVPWVIGESGLPGVDRQYVKDPARLAKEVGSLQDQMNYFKTTAEKMVACGGSGYLWWQFKDVKWEQGSFQNYFGMVYGEASGGHASPGWNVTKPAFNTFKDFDFTKSSCGCDVPADYYNPLKLPHALTSGVIRDVNCNPVSDAVIEVEVEGPPGSKVHYIMYSDPGGHFTIWSENDKQVVRQLIISAAGKTICWKHSPPVDQGPYVITLDNPGNLPTKARVVNERIVAPDKVTAEGAESVYMGGVIYDSGSKGSIVSRGEIELGPGFSAESGAQLELNIVNSLRVKYNTDLSTTDCDGLEAYSADTKQKAACAFYICQPGSKVINIYRKGGCQKRVKKYIIRNSVENVVLKKKRPDIKSSVDISKLQTGRYSVRLYVKGRDSVLSFFVE